MSQVPSQRMRLSQLLPTKKSQSDQPVIQAFFAASGDPQRLPHRQMGFPIPTEPPKQTPGLMRTGNAVRGFFQCSDEQSVAVLEKWPAQSEKGPADLRSGWQSSSLPK